MKRVSLALMFLAFFAFVSLNSCKQQAKETEATEEAVPAPEQAAPVAEETAPAPAAEAPAN
jgi:hypothetical protein